MTFLLDSPDLPLPLPHIDRAPVSRRAGDFESSENEKNSSNSLSVDPRPSVHEDERWRSHPISMFWDKYRGENPEDRELPSKVRKFYKKQDKLIESLQSTMSLLKDADGEMEERNQTVRHQNRVNNLLIKFTFLLNLLLLSSKMAASILSHSLSVISSLMDSAVDLASGFTLWLAAHQMRKSRPYSYPTGRRRLEPVAVIILSVIMASVSVQIMVEAVQTIYNMAANNQGPPIMSNLTIGLVASTIVVKVSLFLACWKFGRGESVAALKNDQLNDSLSNSIALIFSTLSARIEGVPYLKYLDPSGAIIIGAYIVYSWWKMGAEHTRNLTGYSADPAFLQRITFICVNHHPSIERLDTVRAFHLGSNFMVEVDIVLPRDMDLHKAHDIGESLQQKLESLDEVERAFVHLDYEFAHHPLTEHKVQ
ncbi:Metal tolerance protein 9 [Echinococcus granulosus]|uniref:Metal tolerance protein n=1 Tax=Echinococcus granulosus TaxID=6210 RepID=U6JLD2_ECHGR|nr:Putative metal tolerance protein C3 [Echinococcus granulosus]EUB56435.1 Putative metal tolerance protein C3 [Echinococcus granulosus]KAH9282503.1 Metal tolerance protein 9 [Echinococcus granulosus]CDS24180.1 metal tolerance protein [Echinococcus granulosus]